jgi:hypothetical protein
MTLSEYVSGVAVVARVVSQRGSVRIAPLAIR